LAAQGDGRVKVEVEKLFHEMAELSPAERMQYFCDHHVGEEIRQEVEALLAFDSGASAFLQRDISIAASRALPQVEPKGWRCGPYRLLDVVGRGGMGAVYLAERADGEVTQRVAVKLLPPGAGDTHRELFLQERQILASLTHANIARMLDAGHLDNGQPFLAMEYVDGKPVDVFAAGLSVRQKIALFLKVCAAVGYLHRNLVVHRDLKPSNILVTADGEPKLLDFGIAKILDLATDATITSMRMLTPDYASPEQVSGGKMSTATDIYSLGAVLYQLLTGRPAHEFEDPSAESVLSVVTKREVTRPSKWQPELKGDLEVILLKALRKDPQERYGTVEQFAEDLEAFLESRPVRARSGSNWYRTRKFLRRYWVPVLAATLVIASLSAGLYVANRERTIAQRRFQDVRQLANKLFDIDAQVRQLPGSTKARQLIVDTSLEYLRRLRVDVQGDPELALEVGNAYMQVARVEGVNNGPNLGQIEQAERDLKIADELVQSVLKSQPSNRAALLKAAGIASNRMAVATWRIRDDEASAFASKSAEWLDKFNARPSDKPEAAAILLTYVWVAHQYAEDQRLDEALQLCRRGSDLSVSFDRPLDRAGFIQTAGLALRYQGNLDEALTASREAVTLQEAGDAQLAYPQAMNLAFALSQEGSILGMRDGISLGRPKEAVQVLERAFKIADGFVHQDPKDESSRNQLSFAGGPLADILRDSEPVRALAFYDHTLRDMDEVGGNSLRLLEVDVLAGSSFALRRLGRLLEARERLDRAFAILRDLKLYPAEKIVAGLEVDTALTALADHEAETGNVARGIEIYQGLLDRARGAKPETSLVDAVNLSGIYRSMSALYRRTQRAELASALETRRLELWRRWDRKLPNNPFVLRQIAAKPAG
jgi:serine/threonine protein kinase